jgi:hypothetical protein
MKTNRQRKLFWHVRMTFFFTQNKMKLSILVYETTKEQAENKAIQWGCKYVEKNRESISECIGYNAKFILQPTAQAFRTGYVTVI